MRATQGFGQLPKFGVQLKRGRSDGLRRLREFGFIAEYAGHGGKLEYLVGQGWLPMISRLTGCPENANYRKLARFALNVFWIPKPRDWARKWSGLTSGRGGHKRQLPKKTGPRETGQGDLPAPFGSKGGKKKGVADAPALEPDR